VLRKRSFAQRADNAPIFARHPQCPLVTRMLALGVIVESSRKSTLSGIEEFGAVSRVTEQASDGEAVVRGGLRGAGSRFGEVLLAKRSRY
jgi:hypothetical protein